jgi:hypothetical protein
MKNKFRMSDAKKRKWGLYFMFCLSSAPIGPAISSAEYLAGSVTLAALELLRISCSSIVPGKKHQLYILR